MQDQTTPKQADSKTTSDLKSLRLPANYGATLGVKKLLTTVHVGKPQKSHFFRTHASSEMTFAAMLLEQKESQESYLVTPDVAQHISELTRPAMLHAAIDRQNNVFLIPVPLPGEAKASLRVFASASSSARFFAGRLGCTKIRLACLQITTAGRKSRSGL